MKTISKGLFLMVILCFSATLVFSQEDDFIAQLKTRLFLHRTQKTDQIIFVQTDKSLYRQGETIWMKGYVTDALTHSLSLNSLELSIQLTDNKGVNICEGKFLLKNGVADFNFVIPSDLPSEVYYLIAYTPEMENGDIRKIFKKEVYILRPEYLDIVPHLEFSKVSFPADSKESATLRLMNFAGKPVSGKKYDYQILNNERELLSGKGKTGSNGTGDVVFFTPSSQNGYPLLASLTIPSGRDRINLISKIPVASEQINITFFPEGGSRVPGILQSIVYEAKDQLGNPVDLKSDIVDEQGKVVVSTSTIQCGLGAFSLLNNQSQLTMKIVSDIGKNQEILLPALKPGSLSLGLRNIDGEVLSLLLGRTPKSVPEKFKIVAVSNGEMVWASDFELGDAGVINVPLTNFHSSVSSFAVFSQSGEKVAQRLIFTGRNQALTVIFTPDKSGYRTGEEGKIRIKISDQEGRPVRAELAASLADKYTYPSSSTGIESLSNGLNKALPSSDLTGKTNGKILDFLLISNSLVGFDWNKVLAIDPAKGSIGKTGTIRVSGTVIDDKNFPVPNALVSLTSSSLQQFNAGSDPYGEFAIDLPIPVEKSNLLASATDSSGKLNYRVKLNKSFKDEIVNCLNIMAENHWGILDQIYKSDYFKNNPDFFKSRSSVKTRNGEKKMTEPYWKKYLNGSSNMLEILKTIRPYEMSGNKIVFRGMNSFIEQDGALIVVDGQRMGTDATQLSVINPLDVEDIRILLDPAEMGMYTGLNSVGVIEIKTNHGSFNENKSGETPDQPKTDSPKHFAPVAIGEGKYDLKTTLQWMPHLFTDDNGEATIPFKTGNIKSTFVLEIAGFSDQREWIGRQTEIKVE